jgi:hypothetical protein
MDQHRPSFVQQAGQRVNGLPKKPRIVTRSVVEWNDFDGSDTEVFRGSAL